MIDVQRAVLETIQQNHLIRPGEGLVIGVSGGPDSLCLLHVLHTQRDQLAARLHVAHLNHMLRGAQAEADAAYVAALAQEWQIPCTVETCDVAALAHEKKLSVEEAARRARYAFLADVARATGATRIAVAHNADDQSETVLMHWLRGAGLAGLRGMLPAVRVSALRLVDPPPHGPELWLIRPLLEIERAEIQRYCQEHGLEPRFDRSNLDTTFYRNRLRHELLPYLERAFQPHMRRILRRSARVLRDDYDLLAQQSRQAWQACVRQMSGEAVILDRDAWQALHPALQRATLRQAVQHLRRDLRDINMEHIEAALQVARGDAGARATLPRGLQLTAGYQTLVIAGADFAPPPEFVALDGGPVPLHVPGITPLPGGGQVEITIVDRAALPETWQQNTDPRRAFLNADVAGIRLALRLRQSGDRFCPLGMAGRHKLVSEWMVNARIPAWWRGRIPLLVTEDDQIMWICGWRIDERTRVQEDTQRVMIVRLSAPDKGKVDGPRPD